MNILVAMASFKDVYSPIEACATVGNILKKYGNISLAPMCDGGEYTLDVIQHYMQGKEHTVRGVVNPYGKVVDCDYIVAGDAAYVVSSEILRLYSDEERYKNPLDLTDYGFGQVIKEAILCGCKKIYVCLGGTSTVCFGLGMAQALGVRFFDCEGDQINIPLTPRIFHKIKRVEQMEGIFGHADIIVVNDGITKAADLERVNPQKVGKCFHDQREEILFQLGKGLKDVLEMTGLGEYDEYSGNGGGIYFGMRLAGNARYIKGAQYFTRLFGLEEKIVDAECIVTGEGKLDNLYLRKLPVVISELARAYKKNMIFICGQKDPGITESELLNYGITNLICCQNYCNMKKEEEIAYSDMVMQYKEETPLILENEIAGLMNRGLDDKYI